MGLITDLTAIADSLYGIRDDLGAAIHTVDILTRTWSGSAVGDGRAFDTTENLLPTPALKNLSHDFQAQAAGTVQQGDILLKGISKQSWPNEDVLYLKSTTPAVQKFYLINNKLYQAISVVESYISWDVQIRKLTHQTRYAATWEIDVFTRSAAPVAGTFKFQYGGVKSAAINYNDSAASVQTKLRAIAGLSLAVVTGTVGNTSFSVELTQVHQPTALTVVDSTLEDVDEEPVLLAKTTPTAYAYTVTS